MSRRAAALTIAGACIVALLALGWWRFGSRPASPPVPAPAGAAREAQPAATPESTIELPAWSARLYFPGADGLLYPEARELRSADEPQARLRALLGAMLLGPQDAALLPALPHGVEIDATFLADDGVAYLGLRSAEHASPPSAGSQAEMTSIYSLVDTIALNLDGAKRVVLLWNGSQLESFGGHLDTSRPLEPNTALLARAPGAEPAPAGAREAPVEPPPTPQTPPPAPR